MLRSSTSIIHRFYESAHLYPNRPALWVKGRLQTYSELLKNVLAARAQLEKFVGKDPSPRIGIVTYGDPETYIAILAVLASGRAYVPLNDKNPVERNRQIIREGGLQWVIQSRLHDQPELKTVCSVLHLNLKDLESVSNPSQALPSITSDTLAYLFFTSGSTGVPKGVPITHGNLNAFLDVYLNDPDYAFTCEDRFLQMFQLTFDVSVLAFFSPLCLGAACYVVPEDGPSYFSIAKTLSDHAVTVAPMVPSVLALLERYFDEIHLPALRHCHFAGEALPKKLVDAFWKCAPNARMFNLYGPTEATIVCLKHEYQGSESESHNGIIGIGVEMVGTAIKVVSATKTGFSAVLSEERGELCLSGPQVTSGYWNNPEKTNESFIELEGRTFYRTGDVVFQKNNFTFYCGRRDQQVKINGFRVELSEIEHFAGQFNDVINSAAVVQMNEVGDTVLHLFVEIRNLRESTQDASKKELKKFLSEKLPRYMVPTGIYFLSALPLNQNGKIDRKKLVEQFL